LPPVRAVTSWEKRPSLPTATSSPLMRSPAIAPASLVTLPVTVTTGELLSSVAARAGNSTSIAGRHSLESTVPSIVHVPASQTSAVQGSASSQSSLRVHAGAGPSSLAPEPAVVPVPDGSPVVSVASAVVPVPSAAAPTASSPQAPKASTTVIASKGHGDRMSCLHTPIRREIASLRAKTRPRIASRSAHSGTRRPSA
jgi:hypothetical protein